MTRLASPVYLKRVELANFRVFGDTYALDVPDGPSVTLVYAPNGVGKTTFFDAIEWTLTGAISRFAPYLGAGTRRQPEYLTRVGAPPGSHRVSLYFTSLDPIDRGLGLEPDVGEIARRLKNSAWPEVSDLGRYLSITHFLGQSSAERFSVKTPKEQWEALKGPAGIDQINQLKDRIGGHATRMAFTRYTKDATNRLQDAQQALTNWERLAGRVRQLRQLALSSNAIPPIGVYETCAAIVSAISFAIPGSERRSLVSSGSPEAYLAETSEWLALSRSAVAAAVRRVETVAENAQTLERLGNEIRLAEEEAVSSEAKCAETASAELSLADTLATLQAQSEQTARIAQATETEVRTLARVAAAVEELKRATQMVADLDGEIDTVRATQVAAEAQRRDQLIAAARIEELGARRRFGVERGDRLRKALLLRQEQEALSVAQAGASQAIFVLEMDAIRKNLIELEERRAEIDARITERVQELQLLNVRNGAIAAAVAQIAALLQEKDAACPVCHSQFEPGELLRRISASTNPLGAIAVVELQEQLVLLRRDEDRMHVDIAETRQREASMARRRTELDAAQARIRMLDDEIASLVGGIAADVAENIPELIKATDADVAEVDGQLAAMTSAESIRSSLAERDAVSAGAAARLTHLLNDRSLRIAAVEQTRAFLGSHPGLWDSEGGVIASLSALRQESAAKNAVASENVEANEAELTRQRQRLDLARRESLDAVETRNSCRARAEQLTTRVQQLRETWRVKSVLPGADSTAVWRDREVLKDQERVLELASTQLESAVEGYRSWAQDQELSTVENDVADRMRTLGVSEESSVTHALQRFVADADTAVKKVAESKRRADDIVSKLQFEADDYAKRVLQPLSSLIDKYSTVLMTRADGTLFYRAEYHSSRSALKAGFMRRELDGSSTPVDMNPNLFFSEGQLSALSVSSLLAASTTFQWCRWPALLMDDPLQHNDVIHASAFIDLLCGLVRDAGYQIVLSTHDRSEAEYISRKCNSAGVVFRRCDLPARRVDGIVSP